MNYNNIDSSNTPRGGDGADDESLSTNGPRTSKIIIDGIEDDENDDIGALSQGTQGRQNIGQNKKKLGRPPRQQSQIQMSTFRTNAQDPTDGLQIEFVRGSGGQDPLNSTQTNDLLNAGGTGEFDRLLQQIYYSPKCQYFYIGVLAMGCLLIVATILDGFKIAESPLFICVELLLNITISVDFSCRVRMIGFKKYMRQNKCWNKLDLLIVVMCNLLFILALVFHSGAGEISEELLLVGWSIAQSCRMLIIARKQQQAIKSAKNLIDFTNIGLDADLDQNGQRKMPVIEEEEVITFEDHRSQRVVGASSRSRRSSFNKGGSGSQLTNMGQRQKNLQQQRDKYRNSAGSSGNFNADNEDTENNNNSSYQIQENEVKQDNNDTVNTDRYAL